MEPHPHPNRRVVMTLLAGSVLTGLTSLATCPALAETADMEAAMQRFTSGAKTGDGKVKIDISPLVENGNSVAVGVEVDTPMTDTLFVRRIAIFNEKNPQPEVAVFHLNPRCGSSKVATRIRLATTQHLAAIAELSDGSFWKDQLEVIVTIAACTEE